MKLNSYLSLNKLPESMRNEDTYLFLLEHADKNSFGDADLDAIKSMTPALMRKIVSRNPAFFTEDWRHGTLNGYPLDVQLAAVETYPPLIQHLEDPCETLREAAVTHDAQVLRFLKAPVSEQALKQAIMLEPSAIQHIASPSDALCLEAIKADPEVARMLWPLSEALLLQAVETNPLVLAFLEDEIGTEISGDTITLFERALPQKSFAQVLYGNVDRRMRAEVYVDELMNPASRQLEVLARVLRALTASKCLNDVALYRDFILPNLAKVPLGKKYQGEWLQRDAAGQPMLEWLDQIRGSARQFVKAVALPVTHENKLVRFIERAGRQLEWGLSARQSVPEVACTDSGLSCELDVL